MTLTIDLPAPIYRKLIERAKSSDNSPEEIALRFVTNAVTEIEEDSLLQLAGIFESERFDIAEQHDLYLGHNHR